MGVLTLSFSQFIIKKNIFLGWTRAQNPRTTLAGSRSTLGLTPERGRQFWRNPSRPCPYSQIMAPWGPQLVVFHPRDFEINQTHKI